MTLRAIYIPAVHSKPVRLGRYVAFVKAAKASPEAEFKHGLTCWWPVTGRRDCGAIPRRSDGADQPSNTLPFARREVTRKATRKDVLYALEYGHERLIKTIVIGNTGSKNPDHYSLSVSGWEVPTAIAREVLNDPHVVEADSGLFPGMGQSFEWRAFAA